MVVLRVFNKVVKNVDFYEGICNGFCNNKKLWKLYKIKSIVELFFVVEFNLLLRVIVYLIIRCILYR